MLKIIQCSAEEFSYRINDRKLICFGAGRYLDRFEHEPFFICPELIIDNNQMGYRTVSGRIIPIVHPDSLHREEIEKSVLIITVAGYREVVEQLDSMNQFDGLECYIPYPFFFHGDATQFHRHVFNNNALRWSKHFQIRERHIESYHAGSKAPDDISEIMSDSGIVSLEVHSCGDELSEDHWAIKRMNMEWNNIEGMIPADGIVFLQHPIYQRQVRRYETLKKLKNKGVRFVVFVHDYERLRGESYNDYMIREEDFIQDLADVIIIHNERMREMFIHYGYCENYLICLGMFDYLSEGKKPVQHCYSKDVIIAGNLSVQKNPHLDMLQRLDSLLFHLYGPNYSGNSDATNVVYHSTETPEVLPNILPDGFGLVWGGDSLDTCSGYAGEYLRYNNPHKLSLYLAAGLPVIVWDEAAVAAFVKEQKLGLIVHSLYELPELLDSISEEQYLKYAESAREVGIQLRNGEYTIKAIREAEKRLEVLKHGN